MQPRISIRTATPDDARALLDIYAPYVQRTAITFETEVPTLENFRQRIEHTLLTYPYLVAEALPGDGAVDAMLSAETQPDTDAAYALQTSDPASADVASDAAAHKDAQVSPSILGYAYTGAFKGRAAYAWSAETSIYVRTDARRAGVGRALYHALEDASRAQGIRNLYACIATPHVQDDPHLGWDSVRFHEREGYRMIGTFQECASKFGRWYDMVWMEKFIGTHEIGPKPPLPFSITR
ncbi:MAG: GNAT family N-acetyltransferase [Atopobiaceae bacterium]